MVSKPRREGVAREDERDGRKKWKGRGSQESTICHRVCERLPEASSLLDDAEQKLPGLIYVRT